jgi:hypothetical protein
MKNLEILMQMFPNKLIIDGKDALALVNKGYSTFANAVCHNQDLSEFPPIYDANRGKKQKAKWQIQIIDLAKWLDERGQ